MPGPRNAKKKKRVQAQKEKERHRAATVRDAFQAAVTIPVNAQDNRLHQLEEHTFYQPLRSQPLRYRYVYSHPSPVPPTVHKLEYDTQPQSPTHSLTHSPNPRNLDVYADNPAKPRILDLLDYSYSPIHSSCQRHLREDKPTPPPLDLHLKQPCIEDKGDGLHVLDVSCFVFDSMLASPTSLENALCAEFAQEEVLDMLCVVLPEETATILWYNKSRLDSRICPVCKRLYRVGDALRQPGEHSPSDEPEKPPIKKSSHAKRRREQEISGICSSLCFFLAAHQYPTALRSMWGRIAGELDDETWTELDLNSLSSLPARQDDIDGSAKSELSLGVLLKMTRCTDLGLQQIFFPEQDLSVASHDGSSDGSDSEYEEHDDLERC